MKLSAIFTVVAAAAAAVSVGAVPAETNADRFARGLPPLPPARRATPVAAKRSSPSGTPGQCNSGSLVCCGSYTTASDFSAKLIIDLLHIAGVGPSVPVGLTCSILTPLALSLGACRSKAACCENNGYNGVIAIGCSLVN